MRLALGCSDASVPCCVITGWLGGGGGGRERLRAWLRGGGLTVNFTRDEASGGSNGGRWGRSLTPKGQKGITNWSKVGIYMILTIVRSERRVNCPPPLLKCSVFLWRLLSRYKKFRFAPPSPPVVSCFGKGRNCFRCWKISICTPPVVSSFWRGNRPLQKAPPGPPLAIAQLRRTWLGGQREVGNRGVRLVTAWALMRNRRHAAIVAILGICFWER